MHAFFLTDIPIYFWASCCRVGIIAISNLIQPLFYFISIFLCLFWAGLMVTTHVDPELGIFVAAEGPKGPFLPKIFGPIELPDNSNGVQTSPIHQHFAGMDVIWAHLDILGLYFSRKGPQNSKGLFCPDSLSFVTSFWVELLFLVRTTENLIIL